MSNEASDNPTSSNGAPAGVHAILVPGYWLGAWAWDDVVGPLVAAGITPHPVTLPGLDGTDTENVTLDDHIDAVVAQVDRLDGRIVLVGHSGGGTVVQGAVDRRPGRIRRVVYVDAGPLVDGVALMPDAAADLPLPTWDELTAAQSSLEGIDDQGLERFRALAIDHPVGVATARIRLTDTARHAVPASVVCTSFDQATLRAMIEAGVIPSEINDVDDVTFIDLPTGHWPMFSRPADLADVLVTEIGR